MVRFFFHYSTKRQAVGDFIDRYFSTIISNALFICFDRTIITNATPPKDTKENCKIKGKPKYQSKLPSKNKI